jgi:hypothetical protein
MVGMGYHLDERHDLTVGEQQIDRILTHDPVMVPSAGTGSDASPARSPGAASDRRGLGGAGDPLLAPCRRLADVRRADFEHLGQGRHVAGIAKKLKG